MTIPREIQKILTALVMVAGIAVPLHFAASYGLDDLTGVNGIQNNELYNAACRTQGIINGLNAIQGGYLRQLALDVIKDFRDMAASYAAQWAICTLVPETYTFGASFPLTGTTTIRIRPTCTMSLASTMAAAFKRKELDRIKNDFFARCLGRQMFSQVENDVQRIIQENGPDGGQAFESDYVSLPSTELRRATNRFHTILVNTPICANFKDDVYRYFKVPQWYRDNPPPIDKSGFNVDGGAPFTLKGACSAPAGLTPESLDADPKRYGGYDAIRTLKKSENNFDGFVAMAQEELAKQKSAVYEGAVNGLIAGNGFSGLFKCIRNDGIDDSPGHCLQSIIIQPGAALNNQDLALKQGEVGWMINSQTANTMMGDIRQRIVSGLLSLNERALDIPIQFDEASQAQADPSFAVAPSPTPGASDDPNSPENLNCTGGDPLCICVRNNPELTRGFQQLVNRINEAEGAAIIANPLMVSPDGTSVLPGEEANFIEAVCNTTIGEDFDCSYNGDGEIAINLGGNILSIHIVTSSGAIQRPGRAIAACQAP